MRRSTLPPITVSQADYNRLLVLAMAGTGHTADVADTLHFEMERARVVPEKKLPHGVVRMGSKIRYLPDNGEEREVELVYPAEADIAKGKISVLTPIGAALIGLSEGQSISWQARDGRNHVLTVISVKQPAEA